MAYKGEIWLGDLMQVVGKLKPADELARATVAGLLGFKWHVPQKAIIRSTPPSGRRTTPQMDRKESDSQSDSVSPSKQDKHAGASSNEKSQTIKNLLKPVEVSQFELKRLDNPWKAVKPLEEVTHQHLRSELPYEPLFKRSWSREILAAVVARQELVGGVDVEQLVRLVTEGAAIERIPQLSARTLTKGVQLLVDNGVAMEPFQRDQTHVVAILKAVIGQSQVQEVYFSDCPTRGCFAPQGLKTISCRLPAPGTPVLALSDLGIGGPALHRQRGSVSEWTRFARQLDQQGSLLIALVPYPKQRWNKRLTRSIAHVPWDRSTSLSRVLEILK